MPSASGQGEELGAHTLNLRPRPERDDIKFLSGARNSDNRKIQFCSGFLFRDIGLERNH